MGVLRDHRRWMVEMSCRVGVGMFDDAALGVPGPEMHALR